LKLKFPSTLRKEGRLKELKTVTEECVFAVVEDIKRKKRNGYEGNIFFTKYYYGNKITVDQMGLIFVTHGRDGNRVHSLRCKPRREEATLKT
jgi:hypothetical protein